MNIARARELLQMIEEAQNEILLLVTPSGNVTEEEIDEAIDLLPKKRQVAKDEKIHPRGTPKPCCGSAGPRHKSGCTGELRRILSREQYDAIRNAMFEKEFESREYSIKNRISLSEVNRAVVSRNYDDYRGDGI